MNSPVRVAVIGTGSWGSKILNTLREMSSCVVAHQVTRDYSSLLTLDDYDAVIIATPGSTHASVALPFLKKGIPVFIEKPMATTLRDAKRIYSASREYKTPVFVGHLHLYNPAFIALKAHLKKIGRVRHLIGEGASFGPFRDDMSVIWDWAPHDVSMMLDIMKALPISVQAWADRVIRTKAGAFDTSSMHLMFKNGIVGEIRSSVVSQKKRRSISVVGTQGILTLDDIEKNLLLRLKGAIEAIEIPFEETSPLRAEMQAFIASVHATRYSDAGAMSGTAVVAVLDAAERSANRGSAVVKLSSF